MILNRLSSEKLPPLPPPSTPDLKLNSNSVQRRWRYSIKGGDIFRVYLVKDALEVLSDASWAVQTFIIRRYFRPLAQRPFLYANKWYVAVTILWRKKELQHYQPPWTARTVAAAHLSRNARLFSLKMICSLFVVGKARRQIADRSRADNKKRNLRYN